MDQLIGQTLDRYQILSLLGQGGMGAVYKGRDLTLQRDVAIKVMHPQYARQKDFQERFLQEARTAARLDHPSVVQVYDFGSSRALLYIVMEFIPGDNLGKLLTGLKEKGQWILLEEAVHIIQQAALALDYAHRHGVLHRDIKPGNIMLEPQSSGPLPYQPVLTDLGLAKLAEGGLVTREGTSMGTPAYMSPEQALGQKTDGRSDIYSLGILLFEMAVGHLPFPAKSITEAIRYHTREQPPAPRSIRPELPVRLENTILKALRKNPNERFQTAAEFAKELANLAPETTEIAAGPTALAGAVSLMTQYQQSLVAARGASILAEFPSEPSDITQDRIQIMARDRTTRAVAFLTRGMTVGRGDDCDIVLNDPQASRQHARIEFDGSNYRVIDLESTNGTYLANARLLPGVPEVWLPETAMRIGDSWFRLVRAAPARTAGTQGVPIDPSRVLSSAGEGRVGVFLETSKLSVEPGSATTLNVVLLNQGPVVDHFKLSVDGIPSQWVPNPPPPTRLMPGQQQEVVFTIQPPRSAQSRAGRYPLTVRVASQDAPGQMAETSATLTVAAFSQFQTQLQPQRIRAGKNARLTIQNLGNTPEVFQVGLRDRGDELGFTPPQQKIQVPEGQTETAEFSAQARKRRWLGREKSHPFTVQIAPSKGQAQTHSGEIVSRGLIPLWVPPVLIFLCVLLASAAGLYYRAVQNAQANQQAMTATALALVDLSVQGTLDANRAQGGTATALAITAIAEGDDDGDGLSNVKETFIGTDPNNPDTDGDGLSDGAEVNQWGTLPTNQDSDGDTLKDGQEVNELQTSPINADTDGDSLNDGIEVAGGSNPLKIDTDGDGLADNQDSDPVNTSTPTPDLNQTEQAIANMTATAAELTAQAGTAAANATATAQMAATLTTQAQQPLAYVYNTDLSTANSYKGLLQADGYLVDLVPLANVLSTDFSTYRGILIGPDTGMTSSWGDDAGNQANHIRDAGPKIIGLGEGGYAFFGKLGLAIGWGKGAHGNRSAVYVVDTAQAYWSSPNSISIPGNRMVTLYTSASSSVEIHYPDPISGVTTIGGSAADSVYYPIIAQGTYLLWGLDKGPGSMSDTGKDVFINVVRNHTSIFFLIPKIIVTLNP